MAEEKPKRQPQVEPPEEPDPGFQWKGLRDFSGLDEFDFSIWQPLAAEFIGTLLLVFVGCMSCVAWTSKDGPKPSNAEANTTATTMTEKTTAVGLCFGLIVATLAQTLGHVSGCHINPAVTFGLWVDGKIKAIQAALYILVQNVGAITGAILLRWLVVGSDIKDSRTTFKVDIWQALLIEIVITMILVLTVLAVVRAGNNIKGSGALIIGLSITACHMMAVPFTGASMNTARTLGPAVANFELPKMDKEELFGPLTVYYVGPNLGGLIAGLIFKLIK